MTISLQEIMPVLTSPHMGYSALTIDFIRDFFPDSKWSWSQLTLRDPFSRGDANSLPSQDQCLFLLRDQQFRARLQELDIRLCKKNGGAGQQLEAMLVEPLLAGLVGVWARSPDASLYYGDPILKGMIDRIHKVADGLIAISPWHETSLDIDRR